MGENASSPDPRELGDDELSRALGGYGEWSSWLESAMRRTWVDRSMDGETSLDFEGWIASRSNPDTISARNAWIADGRPEEATYCFEGGKVWVQ